VYGLKALAESKSVAAVAVFAALHVVLDSMPVYVFREWGMYLEPLEGIILGPTLGILTAVIGASVSRAVIGASAFSFIYGVTGESVGVLIAGLLVKGRWRIVAAIYAFMLGAYFIHPYGLRLPLWTIMDCLAAFVLIYPAALLSKQLLKKDEDVKGFTLAIMLISFVSTVAHSLTMIFILVPAGTYTVEFGTFEAVYYAFVIGAAGSYFEDAIVIAVSLLVYLPVLLFLRRSRTLRFPLS
jgi:MFS family permease